MIEKKVIKELSRLSNMVLLEPSREKVMKQKEVVERLILLLPEDSLVIKYHNILWSYIN